MRWIVQHAKVLAASIVLLLTIAVLLFHFVIIPGHTTRMLVLEGHEVLGTGSWGPGWFYGRNWDQMILTPRPPMAVIIQGPLSPHCASLIAKENSIKELKFAGKGVHNADIKLLADQLEKVGERRYSRTSVIWIDGIDTPLDSMTAIEEFPKLKRLRIVNMSLQSSNLKWFGKLSSLVDLSISKTPIDDEALRYIVDSPFRTTLRSLELDRTEITDAAGVHLSKMTGLKKLAMSHCRFGDEGAHAIGGALKIEFLWMSDTDVTVVGLRELARSPNLKDVVAHHLDLSHEEKYKLIADFPNVSFDVTIRQ